MREELLNKIKEELEKEKKRLVDQIERNKQIKSLISDKNVKEFLNLTGLTYQISCTERKATNDIIESIYYKYLYQIKDDETNGLYVYMGTYKYTDEIDIVHASHDIVVPYHAIDANYRLYCNIEKTSSERVLIRNCAEFEKKNTIINPKLAFNESCVKLYD